MFDGSGAEPVQAHLAVAGGRIRALAPRLTLQARKTSAAEGLALMPGIVDSHTDVDAKITLGPPRCGLRPRWA